jgi:hypothetical protein
MWLQLLTSKSEAAEAIKKFKARAEAESSKKLRVFDPAPVLIRPVFGPVSVYPVKNKNERFVK